MSTLTAGTIFEPRGPVAAQVEDLLRWTAASGDYSPIHFDPAIAQARGFAGPLVHGPWKAAVLRHLAIGWLGGGAHITSISTRYLRPDVVGEELEFGGSVSSVETGGDGCLAVQCDLWVRNASGQITVEADCSASIDPAGADPAAATTLPLERLKAAVRLGEVSGVFTYRVEENDLVAFAGAVDSRVPLDGIAPPTYFAALDPVERRDMELDGFLQHLPFEMTGGGNAFNEVEYERPIRVGDVLTVSTRYTEVYEKTGSRGTLLFRVRENEMRDAAGSLVATSRCAHVLSYRIEANR